MSWNEDRARNRISRLLQSAPVTDLSVREFRAFMDERRLVAEMARARGERFDEPIFSVPLNRAITTHGVHIYAALMDFNAHQAEAAQETEDGDRRSMQFLHRHYEAADQLIASYGIQRVDFHGPRLHAVVLNPSGPDQEAERLEIALAFAAAFRDMVDRMADWFGESLRSRVRIGIDSGRAVAINSGRRGEMEPLFIGSPANHAAKAAAGEAPGIYLTGRAELVRRSGRMGMASLTEANLLDSGEEFLALAKTITAGGRAADGRTRLNEAFDAYVRHRQMVGMGDGQSASFVFHHHKPPLKSIVYADHPPSNAIRMVLASIFADIDGFTRYVDEGIANGAVAQVVANLHVMRGEMNHVTRDDFGGRKLRYIGDCLQALLAMGDARTTDECETVRHAVLAAAGIRSSFDLCRALLPGASDLGIAIGIEIGHTPISRLGLRGEASVRCASSRATCVSEAVQQKCSGSQTALGPAALDAADVHVRRLFLSGAVPNFNYPTAATLLAGAAASAAIIAPSIIRAEAKPLMAWAN